MLAGEGKWWQVRVCGCRWGRVVTSESKWRLICISGCKVDVVAVGFHDVCGMSLSLVGDVELLVVSGGR